MSEISSSQEQHFLAAGGFSAPHSHILTISVSVTDSYTIFSVASSTTLTLNKSIVLSLFH